MLVRPSSAIEKQHLAFIKVDTNWSWEDLKEAVLVEATKYGKQQGVEAYKVVRGLRVLGGLGMRPDSESVVGEENCKGMLRRLDEGVGEVVLVAEVG